MTSPNRLSTASNRSSTSATPPVDTIEQVDGRFDELRAEMNRRFDEPSSQMRTLHEALRGEFKIVTDGLATVLERFDVQTIERARVDARLDDYEGRLIALESRRPRRR